MNKKMKWTKTTIFATFALVATMLGATISGYTNLDQANASQSSSNAFVGTVENTTSATLNRVRIEVHLSNGVELGPTTPIDLAAGEVMDVVLPATAQAFDGWTPHAEVGASEGGEGGGEHGNEGGESGNENGESGAEGGEGGGEHGNGGESNG